MIKEDTDLKKVGILTLSHTDNKNYGAMLQSFALYSMVQNLGCIPYIINWEFHQKMTLSYKDITSQLKSQYLYLCFRRFLGVKLGSIIQKISSIIGEKSFKLFSDQFLPNKTFKVTRENIADLNNDIETFIVGSDQVWRATSPDLYAFFLDFVNDSCRKISYAASFGIDQWNEATDKVTDEVSKLIKRFDYISVRELSGVEICDSIFDVHAHFVLDPTLMLSVNQYRPIFESESDDDLRDNDYIACMILDSKSSESICRSLNEKLSLPAISIRGKDITILSLTFIRYNTIARWLNYIRHAQFVVTDSYHCVIFSILFKKKFAVIAHKKRGIARLESLLNLLNLKDRLFKDEEAFMNSNIWNQEIDFNRVENILEMERQKSLDFITNSLK